MERYNTIHVEKFDQVYNINSCSLEQKWEFVGMLYKEPPGFCNPELAVNKGNAFPIFTVSENYLNKAGAYPLLRRRVDNACGCFKTKYFIHQSIPPFLEPPAILNCSKEDPALAFAVALPPATAALWSTPGRHINSLCTSWGEKGYQLGVSLTNGVTTLLL